MAKNTEIIRQRLFKTENYLGDFNPNKQGGYDQLDQVSLFGAVWESKIDDNVSAPATWDGGDIITPNTQDWMQVSGDYEAWLLNKDKPATTGTTGDHPYNGMGRVTLKKNMVNVGTEADPEYVNTLTQDMFYKGEAGSRVPNTDTVFVIKYDFTLREDITIPADCVLEFDGGSISGSYTITGTNTQIKSQDVAIFDNGIIISGTWFCPKISSVWFADAQEENRLKQVFNLTSSDIWNEVYIASGTYLVSVAVDGGTAIDVSKDNITILLSGTIQMKTNGFQRYKTVRLSGSNINLYGGEIKGDAKTHDYTTTSGTHEWGHGLVFDECTNVNVYDLKSSLCTGDAFLVRATASFINMINVDARLSRRQGITIAGHDVNIENFNIVSIGNFSIDGVYINGTDPSAGIDIEPDGNDQAYNINIINGVITSCKIGILSYHQDGEYYNHNIKIESVKISQITNEDIAITNTRQVYINRFVGGGNYLLITNSEEILISSSDFYTFANVKSSNITTISSKINTCRFSNNIDKIYDTVLNNCIIGMILCGSGNHIYLNNCRTATNNDATVIFSQDFTLKDFTIESTGCKFYKVNQEASVGLAVLRAQENVEYIFRNCELYGNYDPVEAITYFANPEVNSAAKVTLIDTFYSRYDNLENKYVKSDAYVLSNGIPYANIVYNNPEYVMGNTRPSLSKYAVGHKFFDTNLSPAKPIFWNGTAWVDATGATV